MLLRPLRQVRAGSSVTLRVEARNLRSTTRPLYNPTTVALRLRDALGAVVVNYTSMTNVDTGVYTSTYQTSLTTSPLGVWRADIRVTDSDGVISISIPEDVFQLVPQSGSA